ncbi:TOMM precursor leader peptide-binding protein [Streptomyces sp. RerS4]|uniref:TOMM precursor leader peptide-binding protein n=1 Tax=Streptomyces sp. RerS4 TaxID=2942449 RepID=UPI00201C8E6D|nr:TOMM precursor leader peptide-binding protein [Streptomyces sp. RerS4]UQX00034.1 TOMM precursor leader peptide-binding protein [Streptomyces sp. RerS4]
MSTLTTEAAAPPVTGLLGPLSVHVLDAATATTITDGTAAVLLTEWTLGVAEELSRHALDHPVTLVPVRFDGALAVIGPVLRPGAAACLSCTEYQRLATAGGRVPWQSPALALAGVPSPALAASVGALAQELLDEETEAAPRAEATPDAESAPDPRTAAVHVVHQGRGTWTTHRVRPIGGCAVCHPLPPDSAPASATAPGSATVSVPASASVSAAASASAPASGPASAPVPAPVPGSASAFDSGSASVPDFGSASAAATASAPPPPRPSLPPVPSPTPTSCVSPTHV